MHKAVILARGLGTRMRKQDGSAKLSAEEAAVAATGVKAMIPIDRPFLDYVMTALADAGYSEVCLVIGPEHQQVRDYYGGLDLKRISVSFAVQAEPRGTADAVAAAEEFAGDDYFLCINSDNYYPPQAIGELRTRLETSGLAGFGRDAMIAGGNVPADRIAKFAVIETNQQGHMTRIIEKPDEATLAALPEPVLVSMNCWRLGPSIFEACRHIEPSPRGELEITSAVQYAMDELGEIFGVLPYEQAVLDLSNRGDIASVKQRLAGSEVNL
jgi:glucose-1-phosphate thymidylyltransferase